MDFLPTSFYFLNELFKCADLSFILTQRSSAVGDPFFSPFFYLFFSSSLDLLHTIDGFSFPLQNLLSSQSPRTAFFRH